MSTCLSCWNIYGNRQTKIIEKRNFVKLYMFFRRIFPREIILTLMDYALYQSLLSYFLHDRSRVRSKVVLFYMERSMRESLNPHICSPVVIKNSEKISVKVLLQWAAQTYFRTTRRKLDTTLLFQNAFSESSDSLQMSIPSVVI